SSLVLLGAKLTLSRVTLSVEDSPPASMVATAEYSFLSTTPGTSVAIPHSEVQFSTSQAPPASAQPVCFVQAVSESEVARREISGVISLSAPPPYSTGIDFTETGNVWWSSWMRLLR